MSAGAWVAWVGMVMVVALSTTNPLYLTVILLCIVLVAVVAPRTATAVTSVRALALFGLGMLAISLVIATVNGSYGDHILFTIPGPTVPEWLGGLRLGGPVSAEGLVAATVRGLSIIAVLLAFGVFNGAVSPQRVLRSTPASLFQASLVVTIGLTLLPSSIEDLRRVREMRALRGAPGGFRGLPGLVVPAVIGGLERSMRLAEAMEARGYGAAPPLPASTRYAAAAAVPCLIAAAWCWFYEPDRRPIAVGALVAAVLLLWWWWRSAAAAHRTTRHGVEPMTAPDRAAIWFAVCGIGLTLALRAAGAGELTYNPFAGLPVPGFSPWGAALALATGWPALRILFWPETRETPAPAGLLAGEARP